PLFYFEQIRRVLGVGTTEVNVVEGRRQSRWWSLAHCCFARFMDGASFSILVECNHTVGPYSLVGTKGMQPAHIIYSESWEMATSWPAWLFVGIDRQ
ncbi:hypothetical protein HAX54_053001, partial [Datura stramonium]|nr:hypothetical protein [Datura stramonium]